MPDTVDNASLPGLAVRFGVPAVFGMVAGVVVLGGTLTWCGRNRYRIDPAGTALFAVLAAGLLCSPIAWHNYLMLLWPGVLMLIPLGRGAAATMALAVTVVPVSWNADWPPDGLAADLGRSLYCVILLGYWLVLLSSASRPVVPVDPVPPVADGPVAAAPVDRAGGAAGGVVQTSGPVGSSAGSAVTGADGASSMS